MREKYEMDDQIDLASDASNDGESRYPNMSYEDGIREALEWAAGYSEEAPLQ